MAIIHNPGLNLAAHEEERDNLDLGRDWTLRSQTWFRRRQHVSYNNFPSHLEEKWDGIDDDEMKPFPYDVVQALISVKKWRIAETEKERTALAHCLAQVFPIHLSEFEPETKNRDLADLIPFLPPSNYFPSSLIMHDDSAFRADLNAVALLQVATCKGRPKINSAIMIREGDSQPLDLISGNFDLFTTEDLEVLIATLIGFFNFAPNFKPEIVTDTAPTSSYTYFFFVTSATILVHQSFSSSSSLKEMKDRHEYMLDRITIHLRENKGSNDLFYTASIYGSEISAAN